MKFINITGYVSSGSSAVTDYLLEFNNTCTCKTEIRFIRDSFGIVDLDTALNHNWENERASYAIWNFLDYSKKWQRFSKHIWSPVGHSYKKFVNKDYMKITYDYIDKLTDYRTIFNHYCNAYNRNYFSYVLFRARLFVERRSRGKFKVASRRARANYFAHPSENTFLEATRDYIEQLFTPLSNNGQKLVLLDQALPPDNLNYTDRYFRDCKNIIVERDPRDIYVTNIYDVDVASKKRGSKESGEMFVKFFKTLHERVNKGNDDLLIVNFEDLLCNYDETTKKIREFVGVDLKDHVEKGKYLQVSKSIKNVGIWKKYYPKYKDAIDYIYSELKEWCREESTNAKQD